MRLDPEVQHFLEKYEYLIEDIQELMLKAEIELTISGHKYLLNTLNEVDIKVNPDFILPSYSDHRTFGDGLDHEEALQSLDDVLNQFTIVEYIDLEDEITTDQLYDYFLHESTLSNNYSIDKYSDNNIRYLNIYPWTNGQDILIDFSFTDNQGKQVIYGEANDATDDGAYLNGYGYGLYEHGLKFDCNKLKDQVLEEIKYAIDKYANSDLDDDYEDPYRYG